MVVGQDGVAMEDVVLPADMDDNQGPEVVLTLRQRTMDASVPDQLLNPGVVECQNAQVI